MLAMQLKQKSSGPAPHFIRQVMLSARLSELQTERFQLAVLGQGHAQRAVQVGGRGYTKS